MRKLHDFKSSLSKGQAAEAELLKYWPGLVRLAGRKADFVIESISTDA